MCGPVMVILTGFFVSAETMRNSSTSPRSMLSPMRSRQVAAGWKTFGSCGVIGFGRVLPWNAGIFCQKWFSIAFGGEWRLWVRRCISPPVITSMPAISWSSTAACVERYWASAMEVSESWPTATRRSRASYQSGTLCAPMTVVEYFAYLTIPSLYPDPDHASRRSVARDGSGCLFPMPGMIQASLQTISHPLHRAATAFALRLYLGATPSRTGHDEAEPGARDGQQPAM